MSRPLRIDVEDGVYHITARGIERRSIFLGDRHYEHFLELLEQMVERYAVKVHAYGWEKTGALKGMLSNA